MQGQFRNAMIYHKLNILNQQETKRNENEISFPSHESPVDGFLRANAGDKW